MKCTKTMAEKTHYTQINKYKVAIRNKIYRQNDINNQTYGFWLHNINKSVNIYDKAKIW
jgi:hypothetical protein